MRIQMSQNTYDILKTFSGYYLAARNDPIDVKVTRFRSLATYYPDFKLVG